MNLSENKAFLFGFGAIAFLFTISLLLNFLFLSGNYNYALENNKIFNLVVEKNNDNFIFSTKNHLKKLENLNKFVHNISVIVYDINIDDQSRLSDLFELPSDVKFGFSNFNQNILQKSNYYGHNFLLKINFNEDKNTNLFLAPDKNLNENSANIEKINNFLSIYDTGLYLMHNDALSLERSQQIVSFLSKNKAFVVSNDELCNEISKICFISDLSNLKNIMPLKFQEILEHQKISNDKWFIVVKYNPNYISDIKKLVNSANDGFLNINENILKQILFS